MPWSADDAPSHTKAADTVELRREWADVANAALKRTGDEARAIREANSVVARSKRGHSRLRRI